MSNNKIMKAIINAHNICNHTAITAEDAGVSKQTFTQYKEHMENLREATREFMQVTQNDPRQISNEADKARNEIYKAWRGLLSYVFEKDYTNPLLARAGMSEWAVACAKQNVNTKLRGSQIGVKSSGNFRREIERLLGIRIAQNAMLSDKEVKLIEKYESAERNAKNANVRLNGKKGKLGLTGNKAALEDEVTRAEKDLENTKAMMSKYMGNNDPMLVEMREAFLASRTNKVEEAKKAVEDIDKLIKTVEKSKTDAEKVVADNKEAYDKLMDKLNLITDK